MEVAALPQPNTLHVAVGLLPALGLTDAALGKQEPMTSHKTRMGNVAQWHDLNMKLPGQRAAFVGVQKTACG